MLEVKDNLLREIEAVKNIPIVPSMLEILCQTTEMGFAAIAHVTQDRWVACSVHDKINFGLQEGGELKIETTLCNEVRNLQKPIVIDNVDEDPLYKHHHTPKIYGLKSYISVPIILKNGTFFGTLCAIDAKPAKVKNPKVIGTFTMFAELLAFHLQSLDLLERSYEANAELRSENQNLHTINNDLDNFVYTASHDLKSPLNNIEGLLDILSKMVESENPERGKIRKILGLMKSSLKRFGETIKELSTVAEADKHMDEPNTEAVNLLEMVENVKQDLDHQIEESAANIKVVAEGDPFIKMTSKNLHSIVYNLLSNAIKYRSPDRQPEISVHLQKEKRKTVLTVKDNGLGIPADNKDGVFSMYKRYHQHVESNGLGLYLVKRMVDQMKGQIMVESTINVGTTFTLII